MYDELVYQSEEIRHLLKTLLLKTHSEQVSCQKEPEEDPEMEIDDEVIQRASQRILNSSKISFVESFLECNDNVEDEVVMESVFIDCNVESLPSESKDGIGEIDFKAVRMKVREAISTTGEAKCPQPQCKAVFRSEKKYFKHIKIHKPRKGKVFCTMCARNFMSKANLQFHMAIDHIDRGSGSFNCNVCQKSFQNRKALRAHHYSHSSENKPLNSFLCGT